MPENVDCWLVAPDGTRVPVDARGVLVGRGESCGLLLVDPSASRRHALVYLDATGPHLVPLGRLPVRVNGEPGHDPRPLSEGDVLGFPGADVRVQCTLSEGRGQSGWVLKRILATPPEHLSDELFTRLPPAPFTVGGDPSDTVQAPAWPPRAIRFEPAFPQGCKVFLARGVTCNGRGQAPDRAVEVRSGDRFGWGGQTLRVLDLAQTQRTTLGEEGEDLPVRVQVDPLPPAGGQVTVHTREWTRTAFVPGLRFDLLRMLVQPPNGASPAEGLTDAVLAPRLWGRQIPSDPKAVTVLVKRLRQDLEAAGIDGHALVIREHGRTWFLLQKGAVVEQASSR